MVAKIGMGANSRVGMEVGKAVVTLPGTRATVLGMATIGMTTIIWSKTAISTIASTTASLQSDSAGRATIAMDMDTVAAGGCGIRL
jgi:hypothetical protein